MTAPNWVEIGSLFPGDRVTTFGRDLTVSSVDIDSWGKCVVVCRDKDRALTVLEGSCQRLVTFLPDDEFYDEPGEESVHFVPDAGEEE